MIKFEHYPELPEQQWLAYIDNGSTVKAVSAGDTRKEALDDLLISLGVMYCHENKIQIQKDGEHKVYTQRSRK